MTVWKIRGWIIRTVLCCICVLQLYTFISTLVCAVLAGELRPVGLDSGCVRFFSLCLFFLLFFCTFFLIVTLVVSTSSFDDNNKCVEQS